MQGTGTRTRRGLLIGSATAFALLAAAGTALAVITPTPSNGAGAAAIANSIAANAGTVTGASYEAVPPFGTPNGTSNSSLTGFPTSGSTFGILTTGDVNLADDPNSSDDSGADDGGGNVRGVSDLDVTILQVDLAVPAGNNCLGIDLRFLSEEFPEFVGGGVSDSFVAELDTSNWTTTGGGNPPTAPNNFAFDENGDPISINSTGGTGMSAAQASGTTYDGATRPLSANAQVTPGAHTLYLSIFDQGDNDYDSAVFLDNLRFTNVTPQQCQGGAEPVEICDNGIDDDGDGLVDGQDPDCDGTPPPGGGRIAFTSNRSGGGDVYSMRANGTDQTRLTTDPAFDGFPGFASGGGRIAFETKRTNGGDIYSMHADGSAQTLLTHHPALDSVPSWAPAGKRIVFASKRTGNGDLYLINSAARTRITFGTFIDTEPSWSPDGLKIAFASNRTANGDIYAINPDGTGLVRLTTNPAQDSSPDWGPAGQRIVFASKRTGNGDIYLINGVARTRLTTSPALDTEPVFLKDGRIAFRSNRTGNGDIYVMNDDGTNQTRLTTDPALDRSPDAP